MGRAPCCAKVGLHRGAWSVREDKLLTDYILTHGEGKWKSLPTNAGLLRCGKSCRLRWMNYLRPGIKRGNITPEEDQLILNLHSLLGNRWSQIAQKLPGRTDNEIKNHFNTHLRKRLDDQMPESTPINKVSERTKTPKKKKKKGSDKSSNDSTFTETTHISLPEHNTAFSSASLNTSSETGGLASRSSSSCITEVSNFSWPLIELDERSECDDLLMSSCDLSDWHSLPIDDDNPELEKLYDEYLSCLTKDASHTIT